MFQEYLTEIIAFVSILVVIVVYIFIKTSSHKPRKNIEDIIVQEDDFDTLEDSFDEDISEVVKDDFDNDVEPMEKRTPQKTQPQTNPNTFKAEVKKRSVPQHHKITKDDFSDFSGTRILVAEDNMINQKVINGLLKESGIDIVMANDGQEALDILDKDQKFSIILMDAHMPRVDGYEASRIIRKDSRFNKIVIVALSGDTASDDLRKMSEAGMQEQLEKPLQMDALYDVIYAYTGLEEPTPKQVSDTATSTQTTTKSELDTQKGLSICGEDKEFYISILDEFKNTYSSSTNILATYINEKNHIESDKILLDIIGVSANIGADNLHKITTDLKESIKAKDMKATIKIFADYRKVLKLVLAEIANYK